MAIGIGSTRSFSVDVAHLPEIKDTDVLCAFKDLMAASWDERDATVVHDVKNALTKNSDDKAGQEILKNVFRASEAVEEFGGMVMTLKMELDDSIGMSGEVLWFVLELSILFCSKWLLKFKGCKMVLTGCKAAVG
ncbi:Succinate dehydrogenase subunit 5, mitochondrial [Linum perenne]